VLEGLQLGARLNRGRRYARGGQVLSITVDKGIVTAKVQGSRPDPYQVEIRVKLLTTMAWSFLAKTLCRQAIFAAKLLAGEMPQDIEKAFKDAGLSLFPEKRGDLETECSCPDWSNPCKHIAAVYYLLGEEFDRNPFLIFKLRGMSREELIALLGKVQKPATKAGKSAAGAATEAQPGITPVREPLTADASSFWAPPSIADDVWGPVEIPPVSAALLKRLGGFPFWRAPVRLVEALEPDYTRASQRGMEFFLEEVKTGK
jgi:uncharacterized Zn finger protein